MDNNLFAKVDEALKINNSYCMQTCEDGSMYVVQPISTFQQAAPIADLQQQQQQRQDSIAKKITRKRTSKKSSATGSSVDEIYQGQSFPFRLWHLINDPNYDDVLHWSHDGNYVIFPDERAFLYRVLLKQENRIFITQEMKSFVRQLNLYGFHKVQLEKDESFFYLRNKDKSMWPEAVFSHPFFKRARPELLEHVKRRCQVKQQKLKNTIKNAQEMFQFYTIPAPSSKKRKVAYSQIMQTHMPASEQFLASQYPNIVPNVDHQDRKDAKRKLEFLSKDDERKQLGVPMLSPPCYIYPHNFINNNFQMIPPGWTVSATSAANTITSDENEYTVTIDDKRNITHINTIPEKTPALNQTETNTVSLEEKENLSLSPLAAFCASLFQPTSTAPSPVKTCES